VEPQNQAKKGGEGNMAGGAFIVGQFEDQCKLICERVAGGFE